MKSIRKILSVILAVAMAASAMLMSGCSTPAVAMTVDGQDYSTGEYLANLYNTYYYAYYDGGLYQYSSYGMDPWEQTIPYGEEDEEQVEMQLADYIVQTTKDSIVRQKAVKNLMEQYGITVPQEDLDSFNAELETYKESEMIVFGFNKEHYKNMYIAANMEEQNLFYTLYGEGGEKEVAQADLEEYYANNYVAFKAITLSNVNEEGTTLSDADIEANRTTLQGYLDQFNESGDMDAVIAQYDADTAETTEEATGTVSTESGETQNSDAEDATEDATEETTEETAEETAVVTSEEPAEEDANLQVVDTVTGDKKLVEAVQTVEVGKAKIVEYTDSNDASYMALIYRLDLVETCGEDHYSEQEQTCLYGLKFDEFDDMVKGVIETLDVKYNERAIRMCDPKNFDTSEEQ